MERQPAPSTEIATTPPSTTEITPTAPDDFSVWEQELATPDAPNANPDRAPGTDAVVETGVEHIPTEQASTPNFEGQLVGASRPNAAEKNSGRLETANTTNPEKAPITYTNIGREALLVISLRSPNFTIIIHAPLTPDALMLLALRAELRHNSLDALSRAIARDTRPSHGTSAPPAGGEKLPISLVTQPSKEIAVRDTTANLQPVPPNETLVTPTVERAETPSPAETTPQPEIATMDELFDDNGESREERRERLKAARDNKAKRHAKRMQKLAGSRENGGKDRAEKRGNLRSKLKGGMKRFGRAALKATKRTVKRAGKAVYSGVSAGVAAASSSWKAFK